MIVKKVKFGKSTKPKARYIASLVDYIRHPHNTNVKEKIAHSGSRNFLTDTHHGQRAEMIALAQESTHSRMPVSHWIFSWEEHEQPTHEQVDELVDIFLQRMGLETHQAVYGLHHNTRNFHVHIAVNRTHPETLKVIAPNKGFDIEEAHKILAVVEHKQGWKSNANARYAVLEDGEIVEKYTLKNTPKPRPKAINFEHATGGKSAQRIAQERGHGIISKAKTWAELHQGLNNVDLRFEKKGSGAIVFVGDIVVKASSIDRSFSMGKLCKRLGIFEAGNYPTNSKPLTPEPVSVVHLAEWHKYQDNSRKRQKKQSFIAWLKERGLYKQAEQWRYRRAYEQEQAKGKSQAVNVSSENIKEMQAFELYAKAIDADRYRVTVINMRPNRTQKVFILDKQGGITKGFTPRELIQRMPEMLQLQNRRENIYYTPLSDDKYHILIDDMTIENVNKFRQDGFTPAVILESSPNNYQCILTIRKPDSPFAHEASNKLTTMLNKEYGDPNLSGCIHPHRAPHFGNFKQKYQLPNGGFPRVRLAFAEKQDCDMRNKAYLMARSIAKEYEEQERQKAQATPQQTTHQQPPTPAHAAYYAHYENIRKYNTPTAFSDLSRMDSMIALRMRATGHSRQEVQDIIEECAPIMRMKENRTQEHRDWQKYAERNVKYAFGVAGDVALMRYKRIFEHWREVEQIAHTEQNTSRLRM